jgi:hypothetical protein
MTRGTSHTSLPDEVRHRPRARRPSAAKVAATTPCFLDNNPSHTHDRAMDFAPYQDQSPETNRALSPPPQEGRRSISPAGPVTSPPLSPIHAPQPSSNPWDANGNSSARAFGSDGIHGLRTADIEGGRGGLNEFETSLPIRLDYAASLAYLVIPPAGGVLLLVLEHKSDYVR